MLLKLKAVAEYLSCSVQTVRGWIASGKLVAVKIGHDWRVDEDDLKAFIKNRRTI